MRYDDVGKLLALIKTLKCTLQMLTFTLRLKKSYVETCCSPELFQVSCMFTWERPFAPNHSAYRMIRIYVFQ